MSKATVVYWSGTGNTEAMANFVVDGAKSMGSDITLFTANECKQLGSKLVGSIK